MLNRIIEFSLHNRVMVVVLSGVIMLIASMMLIRADVDIFPDLNAPTVVVMTEANGLAPEEVEKLVSYPLETALNGATGIRRVRSQSSTGFSVVWAEFEWGTDVYRARQIVSEKIAPVGESFPTGIAAPYLGPQSSILGEALIIGLTSDVQSLTELRTIADRRLAPRLLALGGVSQVSVIGGDVMEYQVRMLPERMNHFGVSFNDVYNAVSDLNRNAVGGVIYEYGNEYVVKGSVNTRSMEEIGLTPVKADGSVLLRDIADIEPGVETPRLGCASVRTKPAVLLTITKQPGASTDKLTKKIEDALASEAKTLPEGVDIDTEIFRQSDFINASIGNLQESLMEGALMVIIVLFFFLMNLRTTLVSLVALPMSILISVIVLHLLGVTINTMSLGGIAIAIGSLVDDAIVDVENVYKRLRQNRELPPELRQRTLQVVLEASKEVRIPILNSTLIIAASFLPLFFLSGMEGRMLIPLGISFIVTLCASTVVALTLTPVLCSYLLGSPKAEKLNKESSTARFMITHYSRALTFTLNHKTLLLSSVGILFIAAMITMLTLGRGFLPAFNEGSFTINVSTLPGISLEESDRIGREAEKIIMSIPEVRNVARKTGRAELDEHSLGANVSEIEAPYVLDKGRTRGQVARELRAKLASIPGANIELGQPISHRLDAMLSGTEAQIAIKIFGNDLTTLYQLGQQIKHEAMEVEGVVDVNVEQQIERPQIDLEPNRYMMARYGITPGQLTTLLETALSGTVVGEVYEADGMPRNITLRVAPDHVNTIEKLGNLMIDSNQGLIPLSTVAKVVSTTGPNTINRENVSRRLVVSANVEGRDLRGSVNDIIKRIDSNVSLPEGYRVTYGGQFESEATASRTLAWTSIISLAIILMLLYREFNSTKLALIILLNMPLAMIGGIFALKITGCELNIPAIIGFISLLGITTRNGMLLVSRYQALKSTNFGLVERISKGSADRLNPIIMTALTSALALIPIAIRGGEAGNEIQSPLALVLLGGLISSTILNLFVVPIFYYISERNQTKSVKSNE